MVSITGNQGGVFVLMRIPSNYRFVTMSMFRRRFCFRRWRMLKPTMGELPCLICSVWFIRSPRRLSTKCSRKQRCFLKMEVSLTENGRVRDKVHD